MSARKRRKPPVGTARCADCRKEGELTGHQDCEFPQDHDERDFNLDEAEEE